MKKAVSRSTRLSQIESILITHTEGIRKSDLARRLNVSRATIGRDITDLSCQLPVIEDDNGLLSIEKSALLNTVKLDAGEIQAIHIACRLLARNIHFTFPSAASALRKLGMAVEKYRIGFSNAIIKSAELFDCTGSAEKSSYSNYLDVLTEAMTTLREVVIVHYSRREKRLLSHIFHPYQIEPYADGKSLHVIGFEPEKGKIINYKFENITCIELGENKYKLPDDYDADKYFTEAWGIWLKEGSAEIVRLLFSEAVSHRVMATIWHRGEVKSEESCGGVLWTCRISAPEEMVPWIRGWGSDVKVLEPLWLVDIIAKDAAKTASLYRDNAFPDESDK